MKIKNKLIAGGLMSVVACALVGSITGTFAWYQYSNSATASMHGVSIGASQNIQMKMDDANAEWINGNLDWDDIYPYLSQTQSAQLDATTHDFKLAPVSNGSNNGNSALTKVNNVETWYGNPDGSQDKLPVVTTGYLQFSFYVRIAETDGSPNDQTQGLKYTYPAGTLYVTDIAGVASVMDFALRMHVNMGDSSYFVVNPTDEDADTVNLSADLVQSRKYDWENSATDTTITYSLPIGSAAAGDLVSLAHSAVKPTKNATTGKLENGKSVAIPANTGVKLTVTLWIEGFANSEEDNDQTATVDESKTSQWWDIEATVGDQIKAGFELTAVKNA